DAVPCVAGAFRLSVKVDSDDDDLMHAVSDNLVDHPAVLDHDAGNALEILVERCDQLLRAGAMHRSSETLDVSEQRGDLTPSPLSFTRSGCSTMRRTAGARCCSSRWRTKASLRRVNE